ncbi:MAG TPA: potassium-transporting ATPase subunit KdpC [Rhizomicrobium sp.]|nr:potassium-transporting ATPase subunit KdpC [Rhizomicrobium sp.]
MLKELRPAILMMVVSTVLFGLVYPLGMTGIAQIVFPWQANGSLITKNGQVIGSVLIGQNFTSAKYFHGRLSVTTDTDAHGKTIPAPYNAANSLASNLGPTSKALLDRVKGDVKTLKAENSSPVPVDLVTSSASGLDPDITPAGAYFQIPRVARARGIPQSRLQQLVDEHVEGRWLGLFGEAHVNVLKLNLALDDLKDRGSP